MIWLALAMSGMALGLSLVALFGEAWRDAQRAELQRRLLDAVFSDGYRAGRKDR